MALLIPGVGVVDGSTTLLVPGVGVVEGVAAEAATRPLGGDDVPDRGHRGWNRKRDLLKRKREREWEAQITAIYRDLMGEPAMAERAEAILAPVVPPPSSDTRSARLAAATERAEELRRRADALDSVAVEAEIALRLLHRELREWQERDDLDAVEFLLSQVL